MSACQRCSSGRVLSAGGKSSDMNGFRLNDVDLNESYVLRDCNIGGGDYYDFEVCLDCGQMQGRWPAHPRIESVCSDCGEPRETTGHMTCPYPQDHGGES